MVVVPAPSPLTRPTSLLGTFFFVPRDESGKHFADVAEVQRESLAALDSIYVEDF